MKLRSLLYQPLPIYDTFEETYYKGKCQSCQNVLIYDKNHLPSFIIERDSNYLRRFFQISLVDISTGAVVQILDGGYTTYQPKIVTFTDQDNNVKDQIMFNEPPLDIALPCGYFRLKITDFDNTWYSEVYKIVDIDTTDLSHNKLKWRNDCDLNDIMYPEYPEFYFGAYLEDITKICEPEYEFELTVQKNNLGKEKTKFQSMKKMYRLDTGLIPEYLVDAIKFMRVHNDIRVYPKGEDVSTYDFCVEDFNTSNPNWDDSGCLTNIEMRFTRDLSVIKTNCCTTDKLPCPDVSRKVRGFNSNTGYFEDPDTLEIGEAIYFHTAGDPNEPSNGCLTIAEANLHLGKLFVWNGTCFDFEEPPFYITACLQPNNPTDPQPITAFYGNASVGYIELPKINIQSITGNQISMSVPFIPDNFYAIVSESYDNGATWEFGGEYTKNQIENGVALYGSGNYLYRVEIKNFNCDLGVAEKSHTFS